MVPTGSVANVASLTLIPFDSNRLLNAKPSHLVGWSLATFGAVMVLDYLVLDVSLGILYVLPMMSAGIVLSRGQILGFALLLAVARSVFINASSPADTLFRFLLGLIAYSATGLFVEELVRNRRLILRHSQELEEEQNLRREAETHLNALAESNPAAILTLDENGNVISGNDAACELFDVPTSRLVGLPIASHLPVLADALRLGSDTPSFKTAAQCQGRRSNGELFVAQTWFSTYTTPFGRRLAAIAVDVSDEVRDREEQNLRQLLVNNHIVASAVSHEMRNVCGAIQMVHSRLSSVPQLSMQEDFRALSSLVEALAKMAATELRTRSRSTVSQFDVNEVLTQFRIIIEPDWRDAGGEVRWQIQDDLPPAYGESYGLLQVLMNLAQNSLRAVESSPESWLEIRSIVGSNSMLIQVTDSGSGVAQPGELFEAFRSAAGQTGIGLFVSRAILRSYGGDLRYQPTASGACFVVELPLVRPAKE
jgi:two-component system sensor kinase FixL